MDKAGRWLHCEAVKDDGRWVAECLEVAVCAQGDRLHEVRVNLEDALRAYFGDVSRLRLEGHEVSEIGPVPYYVFRLLRWRINDRVAKTAAMAALHLAQSSDRRWAEPAALVGYA